MFPETTEARAPRVSLFTATLTATAQRLLRIPISRELHLSLVWSDPLLCRALVTCSINARTPSAYTASNNALCGRGSGHVKLTLPILVHPIHLYKHDNFE